MSFLRVITVNHRCLPRLYPPRSNTHVTSPGTFLSPPPTLGICDPSNKPNSSCGVLSPYFPSGRPISLFPQIPNLPPFNYQCRFHLVLIFPIPWDFRVSAIYTVHCLLYKERTFHFKTDKNTKQNKIKQNKAKQNKHGFPGSGMRNSTG